MICNILNKLVEDYMEAQFIEWDREIGFYRARQELLVGGCVYFYDAGTTALKEVRGKGGDRLPNPIHADANGKFPYAECEGFYTIKVMSQIGLALASGELLRGGND